MIKYIGISLFILLIIFQTLDRFGQIVYYQFNKAYITEAFCINKEKPALKCNGKCFLSAKLKQQEAERKKAPTTRDLEKKDIQYIVDDNDNSLSLGRSSDQGAPNSLYKMFLPLLYSKRILRPPCV